MDVLRHTCLSEKHEKLIFYSLYIVIFRFKVLFILIFVVSSRKIVYMLILLSKWYFQFNKINTVSGFTLMEMSVLETLSVRFH